MRRYIFASAVFFVLVSRLAAQTTFCRVIVLDTSGSMTGERIATAKAELLALARQLPPTKDHPLILVPFDSSPHDVATFTDLPAFERHLAKLHAGGGTSIASGLLRALQEVKPYTAAGSVALFLVTDGEDSDRKAIEDAELKLDGVFSIRKKQGLPSSVVFLKRWENANAQLLQKITQRGNARVIDAGEFKLVPVTLTPVVLVLRTAWVKNRPQTLAVECQAKMTLTGIPFDPSLPETLLRCKDQAAAPTPVTLRIGDPRPVAFRFELPLSSAAIALGKTTLHFAVDPIPQFSLKSGVVLPQMPRDHVDVSIDLPPLLFSCTFTGSLAPAASPTWSDALRSKAIMSLILTCTLRYVPDLPWSQPVTVRIKPDGCRVVSGQDSLQFSRSGTLSLPLSVEAGPLLNGASTFSVAMLVQAGAHPNFAIDPPDIRLAQASPVPPPVVTQIDTNVQSLSEARWCDLTQGIATFDAQVLFSINGPILPDTRLVLLCPSSVRSIAADPAVVHTGSQTVKLTLTAKLPAAPGIETLDIKIQAPPPVGAVRYAPPKSITLCIAGPPAVQLALLNPDGATPSVTIRDRDAPVMLTGIPVLLSPGDASLAAGLSALVRGAPVLGNQTHGPFPVNVPVVLPLVLQDPGSSFFFDQVITQDIDVLPSQPSPALIGSQQPCTVTFEAPFKRILFYAASALSGIILVILLIRVFLRPAEAQADQ